MSISFPSYFVLNDMDIGGRSMLIKSSRSTLLVEDGDGVGPVETMLSGAAVG